LENNLKMWDLNSGQEKVNFKHLEDWVLSLTYNHEGSLLAVTTRDRKMKLLDPRADRVVAEGVPHTGTKAVRLAWAGNSDRIISAGFSGNNRELSLWDIKKLDKPMTNQQIDQASGVITPHYDSDLNIVYLAGRGDSNIKYLEVTDTDPYVHFLSSFSAGSPQVAVSFLPKVACDVRKCEILKVLRLTGNVVEPVSFKVPRTRMEFFQDDIFPPTTAIEPALSSSDWFSGQNKTPKLVDLKPHDMELLSRAPAIVKEVRKVEVTDDGEVSKAQVMDSYFNKVTEWRDAKVNQTKDTQGVEASEWDD